MTECERIVARNLIDSSFLEPEERDGWQITTETKKVWAIELDLLHIFDEICQQHHLTYWAGFGTLLGAVRHKGFIPWDDDLDVWMPRADYDKMLSLDLRLEKPYFLQTTLNDNDYYSSFARLRNSNTTGILVSRNNSCNNGIYIDIYPLDGSTSGVNQWIRSKLVRIQNVFAHAYVFNVNPHPVTRIAHKILHLPFVPYNPKHVYMRINSLSRAHAWNETDEVGFIAFAPYAHHKNFYAKSLFATTEWLPFENTLVPVPCGYDDVLTTIYGNYMEYPPIGDRGTWHNFIFEPDLPYEQYNMIFK